MQTIADIRKDYTLASLDVSVVHENPVKQFEVWFNEAVQAAVNEPNAMHLCTINPNGLPSGRIMLLKGIEEEKFIFYTNYQSKKGKALEANPECALTFFWPELERQVRIEGIATRVSPEKAEAYFQSRPRGSQVGAWSSPQSAVIKDRGVLEERVLQMQKKFEKEEILPKPHQWGGYAVDPFLIEFWQGRPSRLHDRLEYLRVDGQWKVNRLAP